MSRFSDEYDEQFNNQGEFWWANARRALNGRKGQQALRDLREALLALPQPRLIEGRLANDQGEVCAVGALVVHKRVAKGEKREDVLKELDRMIDEDDWHNDPAEITAACGTAVGLTFVLAWQLASVNDETLYGLDPEARHAAVLTWIAANLHDEAVPA